MSVSTSARLDGSPLASEIERAVQGVVPPGATVLVVSKGDEELLRLSGREGWHFPQNEHGVYAGHYPIDSQAAVAHLEALRGLGAQYLLFPASAYWWLHYYRGLREHLDFQYQRVWSGESCIIYRLSGPEGLRGWSRSLKRRLLRLAPVAESAGLGQSGAGERRSLSPRQLVRSLVFGLPGGEGPSPPPAIAPARRRPPEPASHLRFAVEFSETLPLSPPEVPFDPSRMRLHWVVPDFAPGMGGPMAIFRFIRFLEEFGHENTLWIRDGTRHGSAENARRVIREQFVPIEAPVRILRENTDEIRGDAVIATHCWTAYPVRAVTAVRERFYFVQDFEPSFFPVGSEYLLAEATYRFGFSCITSSRWLQDLMRSRYSARAERFVYAYDPAVYFEDPGQPRADDRIAFYGRAGTPRRAVELGLLALEILAKRRPSIVVDFFGGAMGEMNVPYEYSDHGVLDDRQLAELYRLATVGVVFSTTNHSLIPHEMMGCGLPVVELHAESTATDFPHDVLTLAEPTPEAIAASIERLLSDREARDRQVARARRYVAQLSWEKSARQIERALLDGVLARARREAVRTEAGRGSSTRISSADRIAGVDQRSPPAPPASFTGPIVFAGQPEYYRSCYYDLTSTGKHFEFPFTSADPSVLRELPRFARERGARTCVIFRPEWFAPYPEAFEDLKAQGIGVIGYSTEPVPHSWTNPRPDQLRRFTELKRALRLEYDLVIHFDRSSLAVLGDLGFDAIIAHPLPVSRRLFYPEALPLDFDVCFLGKSTPHREEMLAPLKMRFNTIHVAHGLRDEEARVLMNRSRLVLNIHNDAYANFENRVVQALFCGRPILSEILSGDLLVPDRDYILFDSPPELERKVADMLAGREWRVSEGDYSGFTIEALLERLGITP